MLLRSEISGVPIWSTIFALSRLIYGTVYQSRSAVSAMSEKMISQVVDGEQHSTMDGRINHRNNIRRLCSAFQAFESVLRESILPRPSREHNWGTLPMPE